MEQEVSDATTPTTNITTYQDYNGYNYQQTIEQVTTPQGVCYVYRGVMLYNQQQYPVDGLYLPNFQWVDLYNGYFDEHNQWHHSEISYCNKPNNPQDLVYQELLSHLPTYLQQPTADDSQPVSPNLAEQVVSSLKDNLETDSLDDVADGNTDVSGDRHSTQGNKEVDKEADKTDNNTTTAFFSTLAAKAGGEKYVTTADTQAENVENDEDNEKSVEDYEDDLDDDFEEDNDEDDDDLNDEGNDDSNDYPTNAAISDNISKPSMLAQRTLEFFDLLVETTSGIMFERPEQKMLASQIADLIDAKKTGKTATHVKRHKPHLQVLKEKALQSGQLRDDFLTKNLSNDLHTLVVEAPTGTGKSYAYLVPAILSGQKVLVSTFMKSLQTQLKVDIPRLKSHMERVQAFSHNRFHAPNFSFHIFKGQTNYFCPLALDFLLRAQQAYLERQPGYVKNQSEEKTAKETNGLEEDYRAQVNSKYQNGLQIPVVNLSNRQDNYQTIREFSFKLIDDLRNWRDANKDNPEELDSENVPDEISIPSDLHSFLFLNRNDCSRSGCNFYSQCPYFTSLRKCEKSQILIINHSTLISAAGNEQLTKDRNIIIIDESHTFTNVLIDQQTIALNESSILTFINEMTSNLRRSERQNYLPIYPTFFAFPYFMQHHMFTQQVQASVSNAELLASTHDLYGQVSRQLQPGKDFVSLIDSSAARFNFSLFTNRLAPQGHNFKIVNLTEGMAPLNYLDDPQVFHNQGLQGTGFFHYPDSALSAIAAQQYYRSIAVLDKFLADKQHQNIPNFFSNYYYHNSTTANTLNDVISVLQTRTFQEHGLNYTSEYPFSSSTSVKKKDSSTKASPEEQAKLALETAGTEPEKAPEVKPAPIVTFKDLASTKETNNSSTQEISKAGIGSKLRLNYQALTRVTSVSNRDSANDNRFLQGFIANIVRPGVALRASLIANPKFSFTSSLPAFSIQYGYGRNLYKQLTTELSKRLNLATAYHPFDRENDHHWLPHDLESTSKYHIEKEIFAKLADGQEEKIATLAKKISKKYDELINLCSVPSFEHNHTLYKFNYQLAAINDVIAHSNQQQHPQQDDTLRMQYYAALQDYYLHNYLVQSKYGKAAASSQPTYALVGEQLINLPKLMKRLREAWKTMPDLEPFEMITDYIDGNLPKRAFAHEEKPSSEQTSQQAAWQQWWKQNGQMSTSAWQYLWQQVQTERQPVHYDPKIKQGKFAVENYTRAQMDSLFGNLASLFKSYQEINLNNLLFHLHNFGNLIQAIFTELKNLARLDAKYKISDMPDAQQLTQATQALKQGTLLRFPKAYINLEYLTKEYNWRELLQLDQAVNYRQIVQAVQLVNRFHGYLVTPWADYNGSYARAWLEKFSYLRQHEVVLDFRDWQIYRNQQRGIPSLVHRSMLINQCGEKMTWFEYQKQLNLLLAPRSHYELQRAYGQKSQEINNFWELIKRFYRADTYRSFPKENVANLSFPTCSLFCSPYTRAWLAHRQQYIDIFQQLKPVPTLRKLIKEANAVFSMFSKTLELALTKQILEFELEYDTTWFQFLNYDFQDDKERETAYEDIRKETGRLYRQKMQSEYQLKILSSLGACLQYMANTTNWIDEQQQRFLYVRSDITPGRENVELFLRPITAVQAFQELKEKLPKRKWVLTSATLAIGQNLGMYLQNLGISRYAQQDIVPSPFRHYSNAAFFISKRSGAGATANRDVPKEAIELIKTNRGRCLWLCTSRRRIYTVSQTLQQVLNDHLSDQEITSTLRQQGIVPSSDNITKYRQAHTYEVLTQGSDLNSRQLVDRLKNARQDNKNVVLVCTRSFWEGIDVKGEALSLLVIDKLPHPQLTAYYTTIRNIYPPHEYDKIYYSDSYILAKQGFGRLIRSEKDFGVIFIDDNRTTNRTPVYGDALKKDYSNYQLIDNLPAAQQFLIAQQQRFTEEAKAAKTKLDELNAQGIHNPQTASSAKDSDSNTATTTSTDANITTNKKLKMQEWQAARARAKQNDR